MSHWVFLADPEDFGWNELEKDGTAVWDGVKNAVAQRNMRACTRGDRVLIYHTSPDKAVIGIAEVTGEARPDPKADERVVVDVKAVKKLKRNLPLAELKAEPATRDVPVFALTNHPLSEEDKHRLSGQVVAILEKADAGAGLLLGADAFGPAATDASAPTVKRFESRRSTPRSLRTSSTTSVSEPPIWKPTLPPSTRIPPGALHPPAARRHEM